MLQWLHLVEGHSAFSRPSRFLRCLQFHEQIFYMHSWLAYKDFAAKMPFFVSQKMQILSKISSNILDFAIFCHWNMTMRELLLQSFHWISVLYRSQFVAKSVESLWRTFLSEINEVYVCRRSLKCCYLFIDSCKWYEYWIYSEKMWWKSALIHGKIIKKQPFCSFKWAILSNFVNNQYFSTRVVFRHFVSFSSKTKSLEPTHDDIVQLVRIMISYTFA